jgi:hypothetical protein
MENPGLNGRSRKSIPGTDFGEAPMFGVPTMFAMRKLVFLAVCAAVPALLLATGCAGATSASDALAALTTAAKDQTSPQDSATVTVVQGSAGLVQVGSVAGDQFGMVVSSRGLVELPLTEEQLAALEALQQALAAGTITQDEFCQQFYAIVGAPSCGPALPPLDLTAEQQAQAETIFQQAHDQIVALHATARDQVLGLLTAEQQQRLTELEQPPAPPDGLAQPALLCPPPQNSACAPPVLVPLPPIPPQTGTIVVSSGDATLVQAAQGGGAVGFAGLGGPLGPGSPGLPLFLSNDTIAALGLSADQVAAITAIHETLWTVAGAVQDSAWQAFEALLTTEQLAQMRQLPLLPGPPLQ